ncbi:TonB-dependent receptor [Paracoccus litorisediminis]|uniref:TonB-dependent receptor n=1 Tax=Paracoccus litorisediminis TaxID=2006130 RepID=A0A844HVM5_9RHOB|nr:TonB-dependent receptor [Paracoccus litorisediminis]
MGVKAGLLDDAMYASAAIFQTNQKDVAEYLDWDTVQNRSIDGTETRGFSLRPLARSMIAGMSRRAILSAFPRMTTVTSFTPTSRAYPEACHRLPAGWRFGGQADAGRRDALGSGTDSMDFASEVEQPNVHQGSYAVFYFTAAYGVTEKTELSLTVNNIPNKKYFATIGFYATVVYGDERSAERTLRARF